ncbi:sulfite reductase (ferredoxin) [Lishizhenia tianjinensis]|uniref:Sulfite reductase (Ferredoxin) n=1 Tax=Lishizhenia tianjinensis TaxID=477690 RepID=A0A1I6YDE5_9FLAO|nr:HEPN domain-containing protein [Lishizhenia tianjinensis]SFT48432.1 sulfite reductase (ferredoxin) [Lishizhenia tianjinensis]
MQSFRTEIENPLVEQDIIELATKIEQFKHGKIDEEKFRSLRLARGIYGQRQPGVQMIRIKLPYGQLTSAQLRRIADVSDEYSRGRLHITTRQDIQIHHVALDRTPELWAELEKDDITLREACGNTVRNITASELTGLDPKEAFDVAPYAEAIFKYFLRNPIGQEMGRKFKVSFSSSDEDTGLSYMHDLGFIAKKNGETRGFKVMIGGGLGSQPRHADVLYDFLPTDQIIPLMEGVVRIFDRHGERKSRAKARLKFLIKDLGLEAFIQLVEEEQKALPFHNFPIVVEGLPDLKVTKVDFPKVEIGNIDHFQAWKESNVIQQKQDGFYTIGLKVHLGDFYTDQARKLADLAEDYAAGQLRLSLRQNLLIPFVAEEGLAFFYSKLKEMRLADVGYNKVVDITACPGTDTCNLGIASSTGIATELERVLYAEFDELIKTTDLVIKISGCMNACGQHSMANIGFQGMSIKTKDKLHAPALQVLLGGGNLGDRKATFADKVIKIPSKRGPEALRRILLDYKANGQGKKFAEYYALKEQKYFYDLLKDLAQTDNLIAEDFLDWGSNEKYVQAIGIGECAGVVIDLIATLFLESEEKISAGEKALKEAKYADAIYHAYSALLNSAKAILLAEGKKTNAQSSIVTGFDDFINETDAISLKQDFATLVYQIKENAPEKEFAEHYLQNAVDFLELVRSYHEKKKTK